MKAVAWSPDGTVLATASDDDTVRLWNPTTSSAMRTTHLFVGGAWCAVGSRGESLSCEGELWRWLRWRVADPKTGATRLLAAEHFGPLPAGR